MNLTCKKCGHEGQPVLIEKGVHTGAYCAKCRKWIKWLGADDVVSIVHGNTAATPQQMPTDGDVRVVDHVIADIVKRSETGTKKYGTPLHTNNGRDALLDAYQEAIGLVMYLKQAIIERNVPFRKE